MVSLTRRSFRGSCDAVPACVATPTPVSSPEQTGAGWHATTRGRVETLARVPLRQFPSPDTTPIHIMSTESHTDDGYDPEDVYTNPDVKTELDEKRKRLESYKQAQRAQDAAESQTARSKIADEDQPDPAAPDLRETYKVYFRGHPFEFYELGDVALEAAQYATEDEDDVEEGTQAAHFVYRTMGEKSADDGVDEAYWRQYDFDDVMDLFFDLVEQASDVDDEDIEEIDEFRDE